LINSRKPSSAERIIRNFNNPNERIKHKSNRKFELKMLQESNMSQYTDDLKRNITLSNSIESARNLNSVPNSLNIPEITFQNN